jgi:hypothetical protein
MPRVPETHAEPEWMAQHLEDSLAGVVRERKILEELPDVTATQVPMHNTEAMARFPRAEAMSRAATVAIEIRNDFLAVDPEPSYHSALHQPWEQRERLMEARATRASRAILHDTWWHVQEVLGGMEKARPSIDVCDYCGRARCLIGREMIGGMFPERQKLVTNYNGRPLYRNGIPIKQDATFLIKTWARTMPWERRHFLNSYYVGALLSLVRPEWDGAQRGMQRHPKPRKPLDMIEMELDARDGTVARWRTIEWPATGTAPVIFGWESESNKKT